MPPSAGEGGAVGGGLEPPKHRLPIPKQPRKLKPREVRGSLQGEIDRGAVDPSQCAHLPTGGVPLRPLSPDPATPFLLQPLLHSLTPEEARTPLKRQERMRNRGKSRQPSPHSNSSLANSIFQNILFSERGSEESWRGGFHSPFPRPSQPHHLGASHRGRPTCLGEPSQSPQAEAHAFPSSNPKALPWRAGPEPKRTTNHETTTRSKDGY